MALGVERRGGSHRRRLEERVAAVSERNRRQGERQVVRCSLLQLLVVWLSRCSVHVRLDVFCSKVTAPSVQPFLSSMGILVGEETHIVDREVNEVAVLRRVRLLECVWE